MLAQWTRRVVCYFEIVALIFAMLWWTASVAAGLQVYPVVLRFQAAQAADELWLSNVGPRPLQAQASVFRWTQENGDDVLAPTSDMVVRPSMIVVQPGERQMVRIVRMGAGMNPPADQAAYRVVLDELPVQGGTQGVQFVLRYSIPIFVSAPQAASDGETQKPSPPALEWSLRRTGRDLFLTATNPDSVHAKLTEVSFSPGTGQAITLGDGLYGYVLPRATRHWKATEHRAVALGGTLNALVNDQAVAMPLAPVP